jgi:hypothetical protein
MENDLVHKSYVQLSGGGSFTTEHTADEVVHFFGQTMPMNEED